MRRRQMAVKEEVAMEMRTYRCHLKGFQHKGRVEVKASVKDVNVALQSVTAKLKHF